MKGYRKHASTLMLIFFLLSGSYLWAQGDKQKKPKEQGMHHWTAPQEEKLRINPIPLTDESILRGKNLYTKDCTGCHGVKGDGKGPDASYITPRPSNLKAMAGHHRDGGLSWKIRKGKGAMPAWEELFSEEQIWDLVNYIQSLKSFDQKTPLKQE